MYQVQVKIVCVQVEEGLFRRADEMFSGGVVVVHHNIGAVGVHELNPPLRHQLHLMAQARLYAQGIPKQGFVAIATIDVGVVKGGQPHPHDLFNPVQQCLPTHSPSVQAHHAGNNLCEF